MALRGGRKSKHSREGTAIQPDVIRVIKNEDNLDCATAPAITHSSKTVFDAAARFRVRLNNCAHTHQHAGFRSTQGGFEP